MKTVIQLVLVMLLFGGVSAGGTWFWKKQQSELQTAIQRAEAAEAKAAESPLAGLEKPKHEPDPPTEPAEAPPELPVAVRPSFVEGADETSQLVVSLNQRLRATQEKERTLNERQEALKLIFADIRSEQNAINKLRKEADDELGKSSQSARESLKATQDERDLLRQELDSLRQKPSITDDATTAEATTAAEPTTTNPPAKIDSDPAALKRLGVIYDSMPAEVVGEVLQQLLKQNRDAAVVEILKSMKDRQAAKVLATIGTSDPAKAAALTELLKR